MTTEARIATVNFTTETTSIDITITSTDMELLHFPNALAVVLDGAIRTTMIDGAEATVVR